VNISKAKNRSGPTGIARTYEKTIEKPGQAKKGAKEAIKDT